MTGFLTPKQIKSELMDYFAATLRLPLHQIHADSHVLELGVDSIMLVEAQRWLQNRFGCFIEVQQFFEELNTIDRLAQYLAKAQTGIADQLPAGGSVKTPQAIHSAEPPCRPGFSSHPAEKPVGEYELMRSQLALLRDVIEAQNRLLTTPRHAKADQDDR